MVPKYLKRIRDARFEGINIIACCLVFAMYEILEYMVESNWCVIEGRWGVVT